MEHLQFTSVTIPYRVRINHNSNICLKMAAQIGKTVGQGAANLAKSGASNRLLSKGARRDPELYVSLAHCLKLVINPVASENDAQQCRPEFRLILRCYRYSLVSCPVPLVLPATTLVASQHPQHRRPPSQWPMLLCHGKSKTNITKAVTHQSISNINTTQKVIDRKHRRTLLVH